MVARRGDGEVVEGLEAAVRGGEYEVQVRWERGSEGARERGSEGDGGGVQRPVWG